MEENDVGLIILYLYCFCEKLPNSHIWYEHMVHLISLGLSGGIIRSCVIKLVHFM